MTKKYNEIKAKDNMKVDNNNEEVKESKERKELQKVVNTKPKKRKRGLVDRLVTGVLGPEGLAGVGSYLNEEIIIPAIKNIIVDSVTSGIHKLVYKDGMGPQNHRGYSPSRSTHRPTTNYTSRYTSSQPQPTPLENKQVRPRRGVDEYVIADRFDAAHVVKTLTEQADMYDSVSVADYYDLIGVASQYTDNTYGWTIDSITETTIIPVRGGYVIKFPPVEVI